MCQIKRDKNSRFIKNRTSWNKGLKGKKYLSHYKDGCIWSKGLTKETDERLRRLGEKESKTKHKGIGVKFGDDNPSKRPEVRKKISKKVSGRGNGMYNIRGKDHPFYGRHHTEKTKNKIRVSNYHQNLKGENNPFFGKKHTKTTIEIFRKNRFNQEFIVPQKDNKIEKKLEKHLKKLNIDFIKQKVVENISKTDFFVEPNICIYADGKYYHTDPRFYDNSKLDKIQKFNKKRDIIQEKKLKKRGYKILRIWETEINNNDYKEFDRKLKKLLGE